MLFRTCVGSATARGPSTPCESGVLGVAFRLFQERRHPGVPAACAAGDLFRGSIPSLYLPLSTLRRRPRGQLRMTRGRCGSLYLQRLRLSLIPPCRFLPAHWNKIEHRLFSFISSNWRVEPLRDYETHRESHCRDHDREGVNRNLLTGSPRVSYRAQGHHRRDESSQSLSRRIPWRMELCHQAALHPNVTITLSLFIYGS